MFIKRSAVLLLACGALVAAGCGDDDKNSDSNDTPAATQTSAAESTTTEATETEATTTEATSTPDATDNPAGQAAVEQCQASIDTNAQLSDGAKKELATVCEDAASGDAEKVKEATKKVCLKVLEETGVTGAAADQAKAACEATAK